MQTRSTTTMTAEAPHPDCAGPQGMMLTLVTMLTPQPVPVTRSLSMHGRHDGQAGGVLDWARAALTACLAICTGWRSWRCATAATPCSKDTEPELQRC